MKRSSRSEKKPRKNNNEHGGAGVGLKKGPWTPEEDQMLLSYIQQFGQGSWRSLSAKAGLMRCGKSCRLRWNNYLRPDINKGNFSLEEERTIIQLHALLGNRWSTIATHLPKRTDSQIKNHWNSHIKKRFAKMGIDPMTHKPMVDPQFHGSNLSHMKQWEAARLEAEARLVQAPKHYPNQQPYLNSPTSTHELIKRPATTLPYLQYLDVLKIWQGTSLTPPMINNVGSKGLFNQGENARAQDKTETLMQEFVYRHDANLITGDPQIRPSGFLDGCVSVPIFEGENHEAVNNEEWSSLTDYLVLNTWSPSSFLFY